jgi:hypothetical protein
LLSTTSRPGRHSREGGQVLVLFAGGLVALLIIAALAFDVGMMLLERRDQQNAADAAALAGARFVLTSETDARDAARRIAQVNGFDDADPDEVVNIYIPAIHGRYAGMPGFIEVQIEGTRPSIFGGIIGRAVWPVGAYAVATNRQDLTFPFAMLALNPTKCKAIQVTGGGVVNAYANIQSNSSGADCPDPPYGFSRTGTSTINVIADDATCRVVGELQDQGSGMMTCTKAQNSFALPDPLRNLAAPAKPAIAAPPQYVGTASPPPEVPKNCPGGSAPPTEASPQTCKLSPGGPGYANTRWILSPGLYPGGIEVNNGTTAYLLPGIYWIGGGGFRTTTGGSVMSIATPADAETATWGGGVLLYNSTLPSAPAGPISLGGSSATLKLKPLDLPTSDPRSIYNTIVIFQDRAVTQTVTLNAAASNAQVEGIMYVPAGQVKLNGNGGTLTVDQVIADNYLIDGGGGTINILRDTGVDAIIVAAGLVD